MKDYEEVINQIVGLKGVVTEKTHRTIFIEVLSMFFLNNLGKGAKSTEVMKKVNPLLVQMRFEEASYYEILKVVEIARSAGYRLHQM